MVQIDRQKIPEVNMPSYSDTLFRLRNNHYLPLLINSLIMVIY